MAQIPTTAAWPAPNKRLLGRDDLSEEMTSLNKSGFCKNDRSQPMVVVFAVSWRHGGKLAVRTVQAVAELVFSPHLEARPVKQDL